MQDEPAAEMAVDRGIAVSVDFGKNAHATVISYPHESPPLIVEGRVDALGRIASARDASEGAPEFFSFVFLRKC